MRDVGPGHALVGQGLTLPWVIRVLGLAHAGRRERHADRIKEHQARRQAIEAVIRRLDELKAERKWSEEVVTQVFRDREPHT
jgi:hypothetical protein